MDLLEKEIIECMTGEEKHETPEGAFKRYWGVKALPGFQIYSGEKECTEFFSETEEKSPIVKIDDTGIIALEVGCTSTQKELLMC